MLNYGAAGAVGLFIGFLVGLTSVGGSALMTPFLMVVLGIKPIIAVGTDLFFASATKIIGTWQHARLKTIHWPTVRQLAMGSIPTMTASLVAVAYLQKRSPEHTNALVAHLLGGVILLAAVLLLWRPRPYTTVLDFAATPDDGVSNGGAVAARNLNPFVIGSGALVGALVAFTSVGGGSLLFVLLAMGSRLSSARIVGTDVAHSMFISLIGALAHLGLGNVHVPLAAVLLIGSLPGVWLGSMVSVRLPDRWLRRGVGAVLLMVGLKMV